MGIFVKTSPSASSDNVIQPTGPTIIPLIIRGAVGQTAKLFVIEDSLFNPYLAVNSDPASLGAIEMVRVDTSLPAVLRYSILKLDTTVTAPAPAVNTSFAALDAIGRYSGAGTLSNLYSGFLSARNIGVGTVNNAIAANVSVSNDSAGVITNGFGIVVNTPSSGGGGSITNDHGIDIRNIGLAGTTTSYGLRIRAQSGSATTWAVLAEGGASAFLSGAVGQTPLLARGFAGQTANIFAVQTSALANIFAVGQNTVGFFGTAPVTQRVGASAAGIAAVIDPNAAAALAAIQAALNTLGLVTAPA